MYERTNPGSAPGISVPYISHRDSKGGGTLLYVRENIPSNLLTIEKKPIEGFYVELNLHRNKWLVNCFYNPHKISTDNHLLVLSDLLDVNISTDNHLLVLSDLLDVCSSTYEKALHKK